jgi:hypothetical protein
VYSLLLMRSYARGQFGQVYPLGPWRVTVAGRDLRRRIRRGTAARRPNSRCALGPIAALRETSVIIGALIATVLFREPFGATRIAATVVVATGVVLINL